MATIDLPQLPDTKMSTQLMVGVASPLWGYFGAAAVGGVAYWWMTRWTQAANLEAFFGATAKALPEPEAVIAAVMEPMVEAMEAAADVTEAVVEAVAEVMPEAPVGGEAAPISALVEVLAPQPEPLVEAAPEPVAEAVSELEPAIEAAPEPVAEVADVQPPQPPMMEATADPLPAPVAKPRAKKPPPAANGREA